MEDHFVRSKTSTISSAWVLKGVTTLQKLAIILGRPADAGDLGDALLRRVDRLEVAELHGGIKISRPMVAVFYGPTATV